MKVVRDIVVGGDRIGTLTFQTTSARAHSDLTLRYEELENAMSLAQSALIYALGNLPNTNLPNAPIAPRNN